MKYTVKLLNYSNKMMAMKILREVLRCDLSTAKYYLENVPCVISEDMDEATVNEMCRKFQAAEMEVDVIEEKQSVPAFIPDLSASPAINRSGNYSNERESLVMVWRKYNAYNQAVKSADEQITKNEKRIISLQKDVDSMEQTIVRNRRIQASKGELIRPKKTRVSLIEFPDFDSIKFLFIAITAVTFVLLLVLLAIFKTPFNRMVDRIQSVININEGLLFFITAPLVGLVASVLFCLGDMIKCALENHSINRNNARQHRNFDAAAATKKATEFLDDIDSFLEEKHSKEREIARLKEENNNIRVAKNQLPAVENRIPMPSELRSEEGVLLLLQYIDTGRATTIQEAINWYYQDLKDAQRMAELKTQTEYARQQLVNSQISAENSRIAAANTKKAYEAARRSADASERAADAAEETAYWEFMNYLQKH